MKNIKTYAYMLLVSTVFSCFAMLPSGAQTLVEAIADETQTQYALTPNSHGTGFYAPVNDGTSFSTLGALAGTNRDFKILGNSLSGTTDPDIVPNAYSNIASSKKGRGLSFSSGQTLNIASVYGYIYFKDAITNNGGTLNITNSSFAQNEGIAGGVIESTGTGNSVYIKNSHFLTTTI